MNTLETMIIIGMIWVLTMATFSHVVMKEVDTMADRCALAQEQGKPMELECYAVLGALNETTSQE